MGNILMMVGLFLIYVSATIRFLMFMGIERDLKILDYIIGFIPIIRVVYMMIEVYTENDIYYHE